MAYPSSKSAHCGNLLRRHCLGDWICSLCTKCSFADTVWKQVGNWKEFQAPQQQATQNHHRLVE
uniref:Uncharacterized protein n=1 Tax=Oryza barthii TaxID=65489 RepID=A0A0D3GLZ5_9ORYZ